MTIDTNTSPSYTYEYGANGHAARVTDAKLGRTVETEYDLADRPCRSTIKDTSGNTIYRSTLRYDKLSNLKQLREEMNNGANGTRVTNFTYDRDNRITRTQYGGSTNYRVDYAYDALGRLTTRTASNGSNSYATSYTYVSGGYGTNSTTPLISGITQNGMNFTYAYDSRGNITSETRNGSTTTYAYDGIGQLIRVNDPHENATWVYNYDRGGNITSKVKYAYTTGTLGTAVQTIPYTYDSTWKDKLTKYNGTTITYDAIGNPLNDGTWSYTWEKGRQLVKMVNDAATVMFKYDHNGLRTEKYVKQNGTETTTKYIYSGTRLVHMTQGSNWLHFFYDGQGHPAEMNFNGTVYIYVKNLQGDIVGIVDTTGRIVVEYKYDAWGRPIYSNSLVDSNSTLTARYALMLTLNPFRYRGYVYDAETDFYYLKTRYYYAIYHRFISCDCLIPDLYRLRTSNVYAYCLNNPINFSDASGTKSKEVWAAIQTGIKESIGFLENINVFKSEYNYIKNKLRMNAVWLAHNVTKPKGWDVTQMFFERFMLGNGAPVFYTSESLVAQKIVSDGGLKKNILSKYGKNVCKVDGSLEIVSTDDLYYSIQHGNYSGNILVIDDSYYACVLVDDTYDFTEIRTYNDSDFASVINDLGYIADSFLIGIPYKVIIEVLIPLD